MLSGKHIVLGITGSIAAYKAVDILRAFKKKSAKVSVVMSRPAANFISPLTLETLSGQPVLVGRFNKKTSNLQHIYLAREADMLLVAPATANIIGKFAHGIADDFLSTLYLAFTNKVIIAPAMNVHMYTHKTVVNNMMYLADIGVDIIPAGEGELACGDTGAGRLADVDIIIEHVCSCFDSKKSLLGKKILITAGASREQIDDFRFISNPSTGKMGYVLADEAKRRGAEVTLISAPTNLLPSKQIKLIKINTAQEMYNTVVNHFDHFDALVMAAAVADYTPLNKFSGKIKKQGKPLTIELKPTIDILKSMGKRKKKQVVVGFAAEVENIIENAKEKLEQKNLDMIVLNDISKKGAGFGLDTNIISIIDKAGNVAEYPIMKKEAVAGVILDKVENLLY